MKKWIPLLVLLTAFGAIARPEIAVSQQSSAYPYDGYIPRTPTDCSYIKRLAIDGPPRYYFIQSCARGNGQWLQAVDVVESKTPGVIYIQGNRLIEGTQVGPGYRCSTKAPGWNAPGRFKICTKDGWQVRPS